MVRKALVAGLAVLALLVLAAVGAAMFIDVDRFKPTLERNLENAVGRKVTLGKISLALFAGGVSVENVSIGDDARLGSTPFVTAKSVKVAVEWWPLVVSRSLQIQAFTLEAPHIVLRRSPSGAWNFSTIGAGSAREPTEPKNQAAPGLTIGKLAISNGQITVVSPDRRGKDRVYSDVNIEARGVSYTSPFPFKADARTPSGGVLHMDGTAGPLDSNDASATPIDGKLQIRQLDLAATGFVDPASGLAGLIDFNGTLTSNGRQAISKGTMSATKLQLVRGSSPARVPISVDYRSTYDLKRRSGTVDQGDINIGRAVARLTGSFTSGEEATSVRLKIAGHEMPVPELEASLPALAVTLPAGASLEGGTLDLNLEVNGPVDRLKTTGPIRMSNTKLKGFDLGSKMAALGAFAGLPRGVDTTIQTLGSTLTVSPDGIRADALELIVPSIGRLAGGGTIAAQGALDFKMLAQLAGSTGLAASVTRVTSLVRPEGGTPFLILGTTSNPRFAPDLAGAVRGVVNKESATKAASGLLKGLLGRKPK